MKIYKLIVLTCSILLFTNCSKEELGENVSFQVIEEGSLSYTGEKIPKQFIVFDNENDWMEFIPLIENRNPEDGEQLKNLDFDFNDNHLIIVFGEFYNYCCSTISINAVYKNGTNFIVDFDETGPGESAALSQAYVILEVSKQQK